jgi:hypothetical protein
MLRRARTAFAVATLLCGVAACSAATEPDVVTDFQWTEADPATTQEGIAATAALGELFVLGHVMTPSRCYKLDFELGRNGQRLSLRIKATASTTPNCDQTAGAYRYTLAIYNLKSGAYNLQVIHDVTGGQGGTFSESVTIR